MLSYSLDAVNSTLDNICKENQLLELMQGSVEVKSCLLLQFDVKVWFKTDLIDERHTA